MSVLHAFLRLIACTVSMLCIQLVALAQNGNVGIGTSNPLAALHVSDGSVFFSQLGFPTSNPGNTPISISGRYLLWYSDKAAFRVGYVANANWSRDSIGTCSVAAGFDTKATGGSAIALGFMSTASGDNTLATGQYTLASGNSSVALGNSSLASGNASFATGSFSKALKGEAFATGYYTTASGLSSTSMGTYTVARSDHSLVIGIYNDTSNTNSLFEIGNGTFNARRNAITVLRNGRVGIGTSNPVIGHVEISSGGQPPQLMLYQTAGNDFSRLSFRNANSAGLNRYWDVAGYTDPNAAANDRLNFWNNTVGNVLIITGTGNATLMGTLTQNSDSRLKYNIQPLQNTLSKVLRLHGYSYHWKSEQADPSLQIGFLAQEMQEVYPQLVKQNEEGILSVNYSGMVPVLLEAIKEQQQQIDDLKKMVEQLTRNTRSAR